MADNYTSLHIHLVFAVKHRESRIVDAIESTLNAYIVGIVQNRKHTMIAINGTPDHIHLLVRMHPDQSISDLVRDIKTNSSKFINQSKLLSRRFGWQRGYAALAVSVSLVTPTKKYVQNQKRHHVKASFREEVVSMLDRNEIQYADELGFEWV